jgi:hypothetical protein
LEEVSSPSAPPSWKEWIAKGAPGHTSWVLYTVDLKKNRLKECYSFSNKTWISLENSEDFLSRLLTLPLAKMLREERRRIGPPPLAGEVDRRSVWNPPILIEGKKNEKSSFDVFKAKWPDDGTLLALCTIELYFDATRPTFPFPYWVEIKSPHYAMPIRAIDSGVAIQSPHIFLPVRVPEFIGSAQYDREKVSLSVQHLTLEKKYHLFAIDKKEEPHSIIPIDFALKQGSEENLFVLDISLNTLKTALKEQHVYQWILVCEGTDGFTIEMEIPFRFKKL